MVVCVCTVLFLRFNPAIKWTQTFSGKLHGVCMTAELKFLRKMTSKLGADFGFYLNYKKKKLGNINALDFPCA